MKFKDIENIMVESLINPDKKITLPINWRKNEFDLNYSSNTRTLIKHFAYHLELEFLKIKGENIMNVKTKYKIGESIFYIKYDTVVEKQINVIKIYVNNKNQVKIDYYGRLDDNNHSVQEEKTFSSRNDAESALLVELKNKRNNLNNRIKSLEGEN